MNQLCKVCGEPAAGFHFGAFTCEGCKSFFGRTYNNLSSLSECKNNGCCVINKKNRTSCKSCRLRKCLMVGMSKSGSRYGRRSNWFKIHCLLQDQAGFAGGLDSGDKIGYEMDGDTNELSMRSSPVSRDDSCAPYDDGKMGSTMMFLGGNGRRQENGPPTMVRNNGPLSPFSPTGSVAYGDSPSPPFLEKNSKDSGSSGFFHQLPISPISPLSPMQPKFLFGPTGYHSQHHLLANGFHHKLASAYRPSSYLPGLHSAFELLSKHPSKVFVTEVNPTAPEQESPIDLSVKSKCSLSVSLENSPVSEADSRKDILVTGDSDSDDLLDADDELQEPESPLDLTKKQDE